MAITAATSSRTTTMSAFPLVAYLVLAYALSWRILAPAGFGLLPDSSAGVLSNLAPFGPAVAAFVVTAITAGRPAVGQLLRRLVQWRVGARWYLLVLFGVPLVELLGAFAVLGSVPLDDLARMSSRCNCMAPSPSPSPSRPSRSSPPPGASSDTGLEGGGRAGWTGVPGSVECRVDEREGESPMILQPIGPRQWRGSLFPPGWIMPAVSPPGGGAFGSATS